MECPHFAGVLMKYCVAEREVYVPSIYEMREYCKQSQHKLCQYYLQTDTVTGKRSNASVCRDNARKTE